MSDTPNTGPGADLKAAREGMDVSTREVADALNLPVNVIEALEADDYERMPPSVFTRGYLRSYARLLELSPESLLARYPEVTEETDAITGELPVVEVTSAAPARTLGIAAVVGAILIALLVWLLGDDEQAVPADDPVVAENAEESLPDSASADSESADEEEPSSGQSATTPPLEAVTTHTADPVLPPEADQPSASTPGEPVSAEPEVTESDLVSDSGPTVAEQRLQPETESTPAAAAPAEDDSEAAPTVAETVVATPVSPSFQARRITEFGDDKLTFVFSEDCWVEVKSADGENLYSDLNRTGRSLELTGRGPFRILLGYAPGVSLSFNDEPVPLERYSRNNVANLVLGE